MEDFDKKNKDIIPQENQGLEAYLLQIKLISFNVLFVLLKEEEGESVLVIIKIKYIYIHNYIYQKSIKNVYFATAMDYLQMHSFPFHQKITHIWKATEFLQIIFDFFDLFDLNKYLPRINYDIFITSVYFLDLIILLIILDIIFVSYSFSKKKFSTTWPLSILRSVASLLVTVFFLPITETLVSVIQCSVNENGILTLDSFPEIECWVGWHLFHALISSIFNLLFMLLSTIVALTYFQPKQTSEDRTARQDSKGEVAFILNKVLCQILFSFIPQGNDWFLVLLVFSLSLALHWVYNMEDPYYDQEVGLFYKIVTTYYLWTNTNLLTSQILQGMQFNGGLISWLIGLPFIVMIMLTTKKSRIDTLIRSQMKFRSGEQIQGHLRYVLQLIEDQKKDKNAYMLLIGYVEKHKETCQEEDCPLKQKRSKKRNQQETEMEETCRNLIKEIDRIFQNGLKKFPNCTKLRISYAFFLMERFKNKREKSFQQFKIAEKTKPSFDEQFIIYRYKKILNENLDQINENDDEGENDIVKIIAFDSHIQQCEEYMKLSAQMHKEFWAELKEENPALFKLNIIGSKISQAVHEAKSHYHDMQKINNKIPQTIKTFGKYLIYVLNDRENGEILIEKAKNLAQLDENNEDKVEKILDFKNEPIAYSLVKNKKGEVGQIENVNLIFSVLFGYQKEEIQGKQIQLIIPNLYSEIHQQFMQRYFENVSLGIFDSNYINEDQQKFGRSKNGYLVALFYRVSILTDDAQTFLVNYNADTSIKQTCYILTDKFGLIMDISTSVILFFGIEIAHVKNKQILIETIVSDWQSEKKYFEKNGKDFLYTQTNQEGNPQQTAYNCQIQNLKIDMELLENNGDENTILDESQYKKEIIGYQFKIEKTEKSSMQQTVFFSRQITSSNNSKKINKNRLSSDKNNNGFFSKLSLEDNNNQFLDNNRKSLFVDPDNILNCKNDNLTKFVLDLYKIQQDFQQSQFESFGNSQNSVDQEDVFNINQFKDYGKGIRLKRLYNNRLENIIEDDDKEEITEDEENSVFKNQIGDKYEDAEDYHIFNQSNSTEVIRKALNTQHDHQLISAFIYLSLFWTIIIIGLSLFMYFFSVSRMDSYKLGIDIIQRINSRIFEMNKLVSQIINKANISMEKNKEMLLQKWSLEKINENINQTCMQIINLNKQLNNLQYEDFFDKFKDEKIQFKIYFNSSFYKTDSIDIANTVFTFANIGNSFGKGNILQTNIYQSAQVITFLVNFFNSIYNKLIQQSEYAASNILDNIQQVEIELILTLIVTLIICIFAVIVFIIITILIKNQRESILFLFLDIPQKHIYYLHKHCDKFLSSYISIREQMQKSQNKQEGFDTSDESENGEEFELKNQQINIKNNNNNEEEDDNNTLEKQMKKRKKIIKKYKANKYKGAEGYIIRYIIILFFTLIYSCINFYSIFDQKATIKFLWPQYYEHTFMQNTIAYYLNVQKIMIIQPDFDINGQKVTIQALSKLKDLLGYNGKLKEFNLQLLSTMYQFRVQYFNIFYKNPCQFIEIQDRNQCETIIEGNMKIGINNVIQHYFNIFKSNIIEYLENNKSQIYMLSNIQFIELENSFYSYVRPSFQYLLNFEISFIYDKLDSAKSLQTSLVAIFSVLMFFAYLLFWLPKISSLKTQLNRTIQMINMMPINLIKENINIRRFVKVLIKQMDKTSLK
ncbi:PAS domain S-box family protein [Ichthyophthirius multifiliis]|uniref:PAS domain S-box family protein n=1 Tax=Ichthyophthirius multifiliis TaxID=5932 RepID=G0QY25_ICHMU|nr:PAS domain S-box family protein [Ichthyophthirius multifiliis]EGR29894.1 PAS domain S-box family protein [Ichthyophthirius multifiliis]|eukprot:XP_004031130.1 PAS domain S-box family protein [Ichthyophthirius multifiliis]